MNWMTLKLAEVAEINPGIPKELKPCDSDQITFLPMAAIGEDGSIIGSGRSDI